MKRRCLRKPSVRCLRKPSVRSKTAEDSNDVSKPAALRIDRRGAIWGGDGSDARLPLFLQRSEVPQHPPGSHFRATRERSGPANSDDRNVGPSYTESSPVQWISAIPTESASTKRSKPDLDDLPRAYAPGVSAAEVPDRHEPRLFAAAIQDRFTASRLRSAEIPRLQSSRCAPTLSE